MEVANRVGFRLKRHDALQRDKSNWFLFGGNCWDVVRIAIKHWLTGGKKSGKFLEGVKRKMPQKNLAGMERQRER